MSNLIEVKIPDIGDFKNVPIIEVMVNVGDTVKKEQSLLTLESDKATMEVPSSHAGVVQAIHVKLGDKVSEGTVVLTLAAEGASAQAAPATPEAKPAPVAAAPVPAPTSAAIPAGDSDLHAEVLVLGAGPGGYTAAFRAADLGKKTILVDKEATLGGVCLNVGCIPSKALLHVAKVLDETQALKAHGVDISINSIDIDKLRGWKDSVIKRLTGGLSGLAKQRKVQVVQGTGQFTSPHTLAVTGADGKVTTIRFDNAIIAAGSQPTTIPSFPHHDPRVIDSTGALALSDVPKRFLVVGGGIIGLEMATVYHALGAQVTIVELLDNLMAGADADLVKPFMKRVEKQYHAIYLSTKVSAMEAKADGIHVHFESTAGNVPSHAVYDKVLVAIGRRPNGKLISADKAGVAVTEQGFIPVDSQQRTNVAHIFAIGDIVGQPMLAHKATHEGKVAAEVAAGMKSHFEAKVIPSVAYTDPEVAWVGMTETEAKKQGLKYGKGIFPWAASGRSLANGRDEGFTKLLFDEQTGRVIGGGIVGTNAGDLVGEIGLAIEMGCEAEDIGLTIHPHPTLCESVGLAAEAFEGTITDLYMPKKK